MKKIVNYLMVALMLASILFCLSGCASNNEENEKNSAINVANKETNSSVENTTADNSTNVDYKANAEKQMSKPKDGETIATIRVKKFGNIKVKFFADVAPKAVENFITHSKEGYYDGLTFHRVMEEFMIQGGDPEGDGTGGESIWGEGFGTELDESLVPYRGALCMAMSSKPNSIGSQFFIVQANHSDLMESYLKAGGFPAKLIEQYKEHGGYLSLYMQYTVFGQVFEGMDVVDEIVKVEKETSATGEESVPVDDIIIDSIKISTFEGEDDE